MKKTSPRITGWHVTASADLADVGSPGLAYELGSMLAADRGVLPDVAVDAGALTVRLIVEASSADDAAALGAQTVRDALQSMGVALGDGDVHARVSVN